MRTIFRSAWFWFLAWVGVLYALSVVISAAAAAEVFAGVGSSRWAPCGTNGCWRQPPLPYSFDTTAGVRHVGLRLGEARLSFSRYGRTGVWGTFVNDDKYNSDTMEVLPGATPTLAHVEQHVRTWTLHWAPRYTMGQFYVEPSIGATKVLWKLRAVYFVSAGPDVFYLSRSNRITPSAGLRVGHDFGWWSLAVGADAVWRPRYRDSVTGGGKEHPVGVRQAYIEAAWKIH